MKTLFKLSFLLFITSCSNGLEHRETFYNNGQVENSFYEDSEGKMQGVSTSYYKSGTVSSTNNFVDGIANGYLETYYENGNRKSKMKIKNDLFDGYSFFYDKSGKIESKILLDNEKKILGTYFYQNGKVEHLASWNKYDSVDDWGNCQVYFDKKGKILMDPEHFKNSRYAIIYYGVNSKSLKVKLVGLSNDSIVIKYKKSCRKEDTSFIRKIDVLDPKIKELVIDIKSSDYYKGRLNILIETFGLRSLPNIKIEPVLTKMCIQLDKGEKPAKYNIDPIL